MSNELGIALPTVRPEVLMTHAFDDESLSALESARDHICYLLNFQPPWTRAQIDEALARLDDHGIAHQHIMHREYDISEGVPIARIREDTAAIDRSLPYYMFGDDDCRYRGPSEKNKFSYGDQIMQALYYLMTHPKCGGVQFCSTMYRKYPIGVVGPDEADQFFGTSAGLIIINNRFIDDKSPTVFSPPGSLDYLNWGEEAAAWGYRYMHGYYLAKLAAGRCDHSVFHTKNGSRKDLRVDSGVKRYHWNKTDENSIFEFIKKNIAPDVKVGKDNSIIGAYNRKSYIEHGGKPIDELRTNDKNIVDYNNYSSAQLSSMISRHTTPTFTENYDMTRKMLDLLK